MSTWIRACATSDIDPEDMLGFEHDGKRLLVYHSPDGEFFCTQASCTHEEVALEDGLVMDHIVECPGHHAQFDYRTGKHVAGTSCDNLKTYPVRIDGDAVMVDVDGA